MRIGGLSSGIDTAVLIKQLMDLERVPLTKMENRQKAYKWQKEYLQEFKDKLTSLKTKASDLLLSTAFESKIAASSDDSVVKATASSTAINASYTVTVNNLATATKNTSTGAVGLSAATAAVRQSTDQLNTGGLDANPNVVFNSGATNLESAVITGSFKINGITVDIDETTDTINTVLNKINDSAAGVTAELSGDRIILTQKTAGASPTITVGDDTSGFLTAAKILDPAALTAGTDAGSVAKMSTTGLGFTDGYFTINNYTFSVNTGAESVQDIVNKINGSSAGVMAFYDSQADTVTLTSKEPGNRSIEIGSPLDNSNFLSVIKLDQAAETLGADASFVVNGATITRSSNTLEYNGVTFTAIDTGSATVNVKQDTDKAVAAIEAFVNEYNAAIDWINAKLKEKKVKEPTTDAERKQGLLSSDYLLKSLYDGLRRDASSLVSGVRDDMNMLALVGISTGSSDSSGTIMGLDGKLKINKDKLRTALEKDAEAVRQLFNNPGAGSEAGIAVRMEQRLNDAVKTGGFIDNRISSSGSLTRQINDFSKQIEAYEDRLEMREDELWRQFTAMEKALASMQNQSQWLAGQLNQLL